MADTNTRVTTSIPTVDLKNHLDVDANGNVTIKSKAISDAIKEKLNQPGGLGNGDAEAIRVAIDTG
jgi:hypothetical protein